MPFESLPVLDIMIQFYQQERGRKRFEEYLALMYDKKDDALKLPLPLFNPMGKDHVPEKLNELKNLNVESIIEECCRKVSNVLAASEQILPHSYNVSLSLADDLMGGWTNKYSTDYSNCFAPKGLLNRHFVTPIFWTSETYNEAQIRQRVSKTLWRTVYHLQNAYSTNLLEHLQQEAFVIDQIGFNAPAVHHDEYQLIVDFVRQEKNSESRAKIITFLYGDQAAKSLGYLPLGFNENNGFELARSILTDLSQ